LECGTPAEFLKVAAQRECSSYIRVGVRSRKSWDSFANRAMSRARPLARSTDSSLNNTLCAIVT
jgi:hypothetical protein